MKHIRILLVIVILAFGGVDAFLEEIHEDFSPEQFERPERDKYQKPDEVVNALGLKAGEIVADIGAGSGYFSRRFAKAVTPGGFVYAIDIDPEMLQYIQKRAKKESQPNLVTVLCAMDDPMLAPDSVHLIFICNTIHHITGRPEYYQKLMRSLKPGGRLVIVDYHKRELPVGPPVGIKISEEDMKKEITAAGFKLSQDLDLLPYQYFLIFSK
jgi:ubiquinone/menaquinone biosynthesis C-methylase UbiE